MNEWMDAELCVKGNARVFGISMHLFPIQGICINWTLNRLICFRRYIPTTVPYTKFHQWTNNNTNQPNNNNNPDRRDFQEENLLEAFRTSAVRVPYGIFWHKNCVRHRIWWGCVRWWWCTYCVYMSMYIHKHANTRITFYWFGIPTTWVFVDLVVFLFLPWNVPHSSRIS